VDDEKAQTIFSSDEMGKGDMSGKVIQILRASPLATVLSEAELRMLANCGRIFEYAPAQTIFSADGRDERLFLLRQGQVALHLSMSTKTGQCNGEITTQLTLPGEPFGWAAWMRPDRLGVSAQALESASVVALDLPRLGDSGTFLKVSQRMLQLLYARLQEYGLCPPNVQALLKFNRLLQV
jgi:CRP-like cAMP-binding protein